MIGDSSAELAGRLIAKEHVFWREFCQFFQPVELLLFVLKITVRKSKGERRTEREKEIGGKSWPISKQTLAEATFPPILANTRLVNFNETSGNARRDYLLLRTYTRRYYSSDVANFLSFPLRSPSFFLFYASRKPANEGSTSSDNYAACHAAPRRAKKSTAQRVTMAFSSVRFDVD